MYTGLIPFHELNDIAAVLVILRGQHPVRSWSARKVPDVLWGILQTYWHMRADKRPAAQAIRVDLLEGLVGAVLVADRKSSSSAREPVTTERREAILEWTLVTLEEQTPQKLPLDIINGTNWVSGSAIQVTSATLIQTELTSYVRSHGIAAK